MTGSSNDPRAFCECTRQGNAAAAPAKKGRGMAAFANLGGGGCQCNLTHHHQLIYEPILHHLDRPFKRFQGVLGAPAGNRAPVSRFTNFLDFNFMFTTSSSTSTPSTAAATTMELYRRARGFLPFVFTFIRTVDQS